MEDRGNKTIMCSVFFLDIVEYSKKSVAGQISLKERFNSYLSDAIRDVPVTDRIILDTGDGAAINFLGDVEDALRAALSLRESLLNEDADGSNPLLVRMGINLGPVRLVRDINGQPNIVGDGINVAQRVMGFADPGQVLVSRSYYDAVSRLSSQYGDMFHFQGSRTDKHVREHEIYAIGYPGELTSKLEVPAADDDQAPSSASPLDRARLMWDTAASRLDGLAAPMVARLVQIEPRQRLIYAGVGSALLLVAGFAAFYGGGEAEDISPQAVQPVSAAVASVSSMSEDVTPADPPVAAAGTTRRESKPVEQKSVKPESRKPAPQPKPPAETTGNRGMFNFEASNHAGDGFVSVSCKEGSKVFMDGSQKGKTGTGPLTFPVAPGKHTVIVTVPTGGVSTQTVDVQAGKTLRIKPGICGQ